MILSDDSTLSELPNLAQRIPLLAAHYERALPLLLPLFGGTPLVTAYYPHGLEHHAHFVGELHHPLPHKISTLPVHSTTGTHPYAALTAESVEWLVRERHAVGFASWAPRRENPTLPGSARISLHPINLATQTQLAQALLAVREGLRTHGLDGIPLLDGDVSASCWIPFADAPSYPAVLAWLGDFVGALVREHPDLLTLAATAEAGSRIRLVIASNRVGRFSSLPYSIGATLGMLTPLRWNEVGTAINGAVTMENSGERFALAGNVFGELHAALQAQRFPALDAPCGTAHIPAALLAEQRDPVRGSNIRAAVAILEDGKTRTADELLAEAIARGLLPKSVTRKHLYIALVEYIARTRGNGRVPLIVQDEERNFRINRPADDWPAPQGALPTSAPVADAEKLIAKLRATGAGDDPGAFEQAVCDAFAALGFAATHEGGNDKPDGYLDAPLGPLGYRVMLECKSARGGKVTQPDAAEAARWVQAYRAQAATLIGPAFGNDAELAGELTAHGVSAWSIEDLANALASGLTPYEARAAFAPGFAEDTLAAIAWERLHGRAKRVRVLAEMLAEIGWHEQQATSGDPADAPTLTEDAAMLLVDDRLCQAGSAAHCARDEVRAALEYLTHPLVARAVRVGTDGVVVTGAG